MAKSRKHTVAFTCPYCLTPAMAPTKAVGEPYRCTACHQVIDVLQPKDDTPATIGPEDSADEYGIAEPSDAPPETAYVTVLCTLCHTRMHATVAQVGQTLTCPDCGTSVMVTAAMRPAPPEPPRKPVKFEGSEEYALYEGEGQPPPEDKEVHQKVIAVVCSLCGTRMHATLDLVGRKMACPDCHTATVVPPYVEKKEVKPPTPGDYGVGAPTKPEYRRIKEDYREPRASDDEPAEPRPNLDVAMTDMTRGSKLSWMFNFLGTSEAWVRWGALSVAGSVAAMVLGVAIAAILMGGLLGVIGGLFIFLLGGTIGLFWFSKASASGLAILEDTAEGNQIVENWPENVFVWDTEVIYVLFALGVGAVPGFLLNWLLGAGPLAIPMGMFLISPIAMLGMLETGSVANPFSPTVWRSIFSDWWAWLLFYFSSAAVLTVSVVTLAIAYIVARPLCGLVAGPVVVSAMMLNCRLLGGVAWYCAGAIIPRPDLPDPKKRPAGEPLFRTPTSAGPPSPIPPSPVPPPAEIPPPPPPPQQPKKPDEGKEPSSKGGLLDFDKW